MASAEVAEVFIYGEIGNSYFEESVSAQRFVGELSEIDRSVSQVKVRINSPGGSVRDGTAIYRALIDLPIPTEAHIDGWAASIASVIALGADRVVMSEPSLFMIHNPHSLAAGDASEMRRTATLLDEVKARMVMVYQGKTGLDAGAISDMMDEETWMGPEQALDLGFIDDTTESEAFEDVAACAKLFVPAYLKNPPGNKPKRGTFKMPKKTPTPADDARDDVIDDVAASATSAPAQDPAPAPAPLTREDVRAEFGAMRAEENRVQTINTLSGLYPGSAETAVQAIAEKWSVSAFKAAILDHLGQQSGGVITPPGSVSITLDARDKFRAGVMNSVLGKAKIEKLDPQNEYRSYTLLEVARRAVAMAGGDPGLDKRSVVGLAFTHTSSDFPVLLKDAANKALLMGWDEQPETYTQWTRAGVLPNYQPVTRAVLQNFGNLPTVAEGAEYTYGTIGERGEIIQLAKYGRLLSMTREAIINDDLDAFTGIPRRMGRAARRTVGALPYNILNTNPNLADGTALFHASRNNLVSPGTAISEASFSSMEANMANQSDSIEGDDQLNIMAAYFLVPHELRSTADKLMRSTSAPDDPNEGVVNTVAGRATVVADARLGRSSTTAWYLVGDPNMGDTIEVGYLDGLEEPFLEEVQGLSVDGIVYKVRIEAGCAPLDYRGMQKNLGA